MESYLLNPETHEGIVRKTLDLEGQIFYDEKHENCQLPVNELALPFELMLNDKKPAFRRSEDSIRTKTQAVPI